MLLLWCLSMIQGFSYPLGERSFSSPWCSHSNQWLPLVAVCHLIMLRCFHKSTTSLFFSLLVFQQLRSILLFKEALSNSIVIEVVVLFSVSWFHSFICPEGIVMFSSTHHLVLPRSYSFLAYPFNRSVVWNLSYPLCHFSIVPEAVCCGFHQVSSHLVKFIFYAFLFQPECCHNWSLSFLVHIISTGVLACTSCPLQPFPYVFQPTRV